MRLFGARLALVGGVSFALLALGLSGCGTTSKETAEGDKLTSNVGQYPPPPSGITKPRVGVPSFSVQGQGGFSGKDVNDLAADQMTTLLDQSGRFRVIERAQLQKLLDEQNLEGIVKPGELAKPGQVRGVDYLLLGRVTNLRVKAENAQKGFGVGQVTRLMNLGGFDYKKKSNKITTEAGVDIRLVEPTTGEVLTSNFSEYKKTDSISSFGVDILGASADADANLQVEEDDKGKILRLALDDALRKSLPKIDAFLTSSENRAAASAAPAQPARPAAPPAAPAQPPAGANTALPAAQPAAAKKFCPHCGAQLAAGAKFCPSCGQKVE